MPRLERKSALVAPAGAPTRTRVRSSRPETEEVRLCEVRAELIAAMNPEIRSKLANIQTSAIRRPERVRGALSP
jgi:hypothetical protein